MTLVVDLRDLTFLDSCRIGELVGAHQRARRDGRRLVVVRIEGTPIHRVLRVARLDETLETSADPPAEVAKSDKFERGLLEGRCLGYPDRRGEGSTCTR